MKRFESYQSLGDSVEIINGFPAKSSFFNSEGNGLPLIRIRNITKGDSDTYYSGEYQDNFIVDKGDILIGMDGEFNIAKWSGSTSLLNQRVCKIKNTAPPFNIDYVYFQLQVGLKEIEARTPSTTVKHLSIKDIRKLRVYCPPLPVQQKIAEILSTVDEQISATEHIIEKSKELKKGLMQKLFSEGVGHTEFKDTKIGKIPKDWEVVRAEDICLKVTDGTHDSPKKKEIGYNLVTSKNLKNGKLDFSTCYKISEEDYLEVNKRSYVEQYDVLFGMIGTIGNPVIIEQQEIDFAVKNVGIFKTNGDKYLGKWLCQYFNSNNIKNYINRQKNSSTQSFVALGLLRNFPVAKPPLKERDKIIEILCEADDKIEKEEQYKSELEQLKKGLMQQLLTGQKPVKV